MQGAGVYHPAPRVRGSYAGLPGALTILKTRRSTCNGCELEINALNNPYYNLEGLGIRFVTSPRHANMLLVPGPVSRHMDVALKHTSVS